MRISLAVNTSASIMAVYNEAMFIFGGPGWGAEGNGLRSKITAKDFCFTSKINHSGKAQKCMPVSKQRHNIFTKNF